MSIKDKPNVLFAYNVSVITLLELQIKRILIAFNVRYRFHRVDSNGAIASPPMIESLDVNKYQQNLYRCSIAVERSVICLGILER